ncbi:MAG: hypothetical protein ACU85V_02585 [Gammaproteobacteria bacterium]
MHRARPVRLAAALLALVTAPLATAVPTEVTVRVVSRDAKFIGTSLGGARVTLRDAHTGEILASGVTAGSTGTTRTVMHTEGGRRARLTDDDAAAWTTTLDLDEPRLLELSAYGPLAQAQAANRVSATQWVVPGKHLSGGDGWTLEMPGFAVDILGPPAHSRLEGARTEITVAANVVMMCGCPIEPGGLWDANRYEVRALVRRDGEDIGAFPLAYAGQTSQFAVTLPLDAPGLYDVTVYAYDPHNGNTGLDRTSFFAE